MTMTFAEWRRANSGTLADYKNYLTGLATAAAQAVLDSAALNGLAELLRASPRLDDEGLIAAFYDYIGAAGRITDPDSADTADDPAAQAARDALMPFACGACGTEVMAPGAEPGHFRWCPLGPDDVADAKAALSEQILNQVPAGPDRDAAGALLENLLSLAEDSLSDSARAELVLRVLAR
jgi:hypothetical protein